MNVISLGGNEMKHDVKSTKTYTIEVRERHSPIKSVTNGHAISLLVINVDEKKSKMLDWVNDTSIQHFQFTKLYLPLLKTWNVVLESYISSYDRYFNYNDVEDDKSNYTPIQYPNRKINLIEINTLYTIYNYFINML